MQRRVGSSALADEIVEPFRGLTAMAHLLQNKRQIVDAGLVARLASQLVEIAPDHRVARDARGQIDAESPVDIRENLVGIFVEIAGMRRLRASNGERCERNHPHRFAHGYSRKARSLL